MSERYPYRGKESTPSEEKNHGDGYREKGEKTEGRQPSLSEKGQQVEEGRSVLQEGAGLERGAGLMERFEREEGFDGELRHDLVDAMRIHAAGIFHDANQGYQGHAKARKIRRQPLQSACGRYALIR